MSSERRKPEDCELRRDYPEVQFTLVGDEGKSPEQLEREIKAIIAKRDAIILEMELFPPDSED